MSTTDVETEKTLKIPHLRVLEVLYPGHFLTRSRIAARIGKESTYVGRVIGFSDKTRRERFMTGNSIGKSLGMTLLDAGYVTEKELDVDGLTELVVQITPEGKQAYTDNKQKLREYQHNQLRREHESRCREGGIGDPDSYEQDPEGECEW